MWRTSSFSAPQGDNCVQVGVLDGSTCAVRNSKNPAGPAVVYTQAEWEAFVSGVKAGEFDPEVLWPSGLESGSRLA